MKFSKTVITARGALVTAPRLPIRKVILMIETPVQATPMGTPLSPQAKTLLDDMIQGIYRQAFEDAARILQTPAADVAKGFLNFQRFYMPQEDVLKLPDEQRRKKFGERLRLRRQSLGKKQTELAAEIGTIPQTLNVWEAGRQEPNHKALISLSRALDISTDWLLGIQS